MKPSILLASLLSLALLGAGCSSPSTVAQERVNEMQNNVLNATTKAKDAVNAAHQNAQGQIDRFENSASSVRGILEKGKSIVGSVTSSTRSGAAK